jgi:hypothetical protein
VGKSERRRGWRGVGEFVAGDLLADEPVVGEIGVEGAHDVIAVAPGVAALVVVGETAAVGVAHDVEPVLRHAFAVVRTGEEAVDEIADGRGGTGAMGGGERGDFVGRRRQTGEIKGGAADEGAGVGRRSRGEAGGAARGEEGVDRIGGGGGRGPWGARVS